MRPLSIILAILVTAVLYFLVFEREKIIALASNDTEIETAVAVETVPEVERLVAVVAYKSQATVIENAVLLRGQTEAARQIDVRVETAGKVISEPLRKGAFVEMGQLLCRIDPGTREAWLLEADARLAEAIINHNAASRLVEGGYASETRAASAKAALQSAEASVLVAKKELERLFVKAPFAGLLETDTAEIGAFLTTGGLCATVIQLDPIKLVGFVPETEVDKITVGALAGARLASGQDVRGRVTFLSRSADSQTRTFRVEVQVPNTDLSIRDGQTVEIIVASDGAIAHLLPQSSLTLNNEGLVGVRTVQDDNRAGFAPVTILRDTQEGIWLTGLPQEVSVIVSGQEYVIDGVKMNVTYRGADE